MNWINKVVKYLQQKNLTVALAESVTCGLASSMVASYKGASDVFCGSIVAYTPEVKNQLLGVSKNNIEQYTCESKQITEAMCYGTQQLIDADIYIAITGLASAGGSETKQKPVGTVFYHFLIGKRSIAIKKIFKGTPLEIRKQASKTLYRLLYHELIKS
jgi:nicotinamide-nucleotide amidase